MAKATSESDLNIGKALSEAGNAEPEQVSNVELLRRLAALESKYTELKDEHERVVAESQASSGKRYSPNEKAFAGVEGYEFLVTPMPKEGEFQHLKPATVRAVDESEALRWYCVANEMKPGTGAALDPVKVRLDVKPVGRKRADSIMRQKQIGALRKKVEANQPLSEQESDLLASCEREIFNYE